MLGKIIAPAIVTTLVLALATDAFAMSGHRRRRGGAGEGNGGEGARPTMSDAQVAQLQSSIDGSGSTEGQDGRLGSMSSEGRGVVSNPEPGSMFLLASGVAGLAAWRWRRSRASR